MSNDSPVTQRQKKLNIIRDLLALSERLERESEKLAALADGLRLELNEFEQAHSLGAWATPALDADNDPILDIVYACKQ